MICPLPPVLNLWTTHKQTNLQQSWSFICSSNQFNSSDTIQTWQNTTSKVFHSVCSTFTQLPFCVLTFLLTGPCVHRRSSVDVGTKYTDTLSELSSDVASGSSRFAAICRCGSGTSAAQPLYHLTTEILHFHQHVISRRLSHSEELIFTTYAPSLTGAFSLLVSLQVAVGFLFVCCCLVATCALHFN